MMISAEHKNKLNKEIGSVLDNRDYPYNANVIDTILTVWNRQKSSLLDLLSKHPQWNPDKLMIQFDADFERRICTEQIYDFASWLRNNVGGRFDYHSPIQTKEYYVCDFIQNITEQFFNEDMKDQIAYINDLNENYKLRTNMKASKAIGKICREEGWDKLEGYNAKYASLCDCLNPIKVKRHTCISLNPIDFLLMSNGTSWQSCHDIGTRGDSGCYSSGTISYMLDEHSFIFYTVDAEYDGDKIELQPKVQRQVFGYNDEVMAQLRLYPQANDYGAEAIYDDMRAIVQKVLADCIEKPNMWIKSKNTEDVIRRGYDATCYPDWEEDNPGAEHCSISTLKDRANGKEHRKIVFGAEPICVCCGDRHWDTESIMCCDGGHYCEECGEWISDDDICWSGIWDDVPCCSDCVTYCERCNHYELNEDIHEVDGDNICQRCIDKADDIFQCDDCREYHYDSYLTHTEDGYDYCEDCVEDNTFTCPVCGKLYSNEASNYDDETNETYCDYCYDELLDEREEEENDEDEATA